MKDDDENKPQIKIQGLNNKDGTYNRKDYVDGKLVNEEFIDYRPQQHNPKLKEMLEQLKNPQAQKPISENISDSRKQYKSKQKNSAEIIQIHPNGNLDWSQSDLYRNVTDDAYFLGYDDAEKNLMEHLDKMKKELEKMRSLLASVKHIVSVASI